MSVKIFTFWEGPMPAYIRLCLETWRFPFHVISYMNLREYTDLQVEPLQRFTLPQIADCVRVHVLRDQGGVWLDADTVMLGGRLPEEDMIGDPAERTVSIGYLRAKEPHMDLYDAWAAYQDDVIADPGSGTHWSVVGNDFTDPWVKENPTVTIADIDNRWPETYMIREPVGRFVKYREFYFHSACGAGELRPTDMLMLHNSWTPEWYRALTRREVLRNTCTLSNILREALAKEEQK